MLVNVMNHRMLWKSLNENLIGKKEEREKNARIQVHGYVVPYKRINNKGPINF